MRSIFSSIGGALILTAIIVYEEPQAQEQFSIATDLETFVEDALEQIGVPVGVTVAVYTPDATYARGFGLADVDAAEPSTADTAFYIASSTKSFNALAMNVLHHRGAIDLDATLSDYAPGAPFPATIHPDEVKLRELLTHTSGIVNRGLVFRTAYSGDYTPDVLWTLLGASVPNDAAPHGSFQYTNAGYNILTVLTDRILGIRWQDLIAQEIVAPAGMMRTTAYVSEAQRDGWSIARPYTVTPDGRALQPIYLEKVDATMQSAGGMVMSANDALLWLELLINDGRIGGRQIVPAEAVQETREPLAEVNMQFGDYFREHYGLGWYLSSYGGDRMIHHFGGFTGFRAHVSYLPDRKIGVAVFTNNSAIDSILPDAIANYVYDRLAGRQGGQAARSAIIARLGEGYRAVIDGRAAGRRERASYSMALSRPLQSYAANYLHPQMGRLAISVEGDNLVAEIGLLRAVLEPSADPNTANVELVPGEMWSLAFEIEDDVPAEVNLAGARFVRE